MDVDLAGQISLIDAGFSGEIGISAHNLVTNQRFDYQADLSFSPASTIKLPLLYTLWCGALEGRWSLDDTITLTSANMVKGSGVLLDLTTGLRLSVRDTATLMIVVSDNTATNMLIDLCTVEAVNRRMDELGLHGLRLNRKIGLGMHRPLGEATPQAMAALLTLIARHEVLTPQACDEMIAILQRQKFKELTNRYIPQTDSEDDEPSVHIASKSGWVRGTRNDVSLIWTPHSRYVLSMFSQGCKDRRFYHDNEGSVALARISAAVYEAWGQ